MVELKLVSSKETHKATTEEGGKDCEVPFKPEPSKPIYRRECYGKKRPARPIRQD